MAEQVQVRDMAYGGAGVARLADGAAVFVDGVLPGETVAVEIAERRRNFVRGRLLEVLEPAPERIAPPCPHFLEGCGGCQWQHAAYEAQVQYKQRILADQLRRFGGIAEPPLLPPVPSPKPFGYRNTAELHLSGRKLGFHREGSHDLVDVRHCPLLEEPLDRALTVARQLLPGAASPIESVQLRAGLDAVQLTLFVQDDPRALKLLAADLAQAVGGECRVAGVRVGSDRTRGLHGQPHVQLSLGGRRFRVSAQSFFQVNNAVAELLAAAVVAPAPKNGRVLDLFSGVGTFGLLMADAADEVVGVESSPSACADAEANRAESGADNVRFRPEDAAKAAPIAAENWHYAVLDPPRAGCARPVLEALNAERVAYVSCDPSTLARDLKILLARGYRLTSAQLFDMFPQTFHIEALALLERG